jgi:mannose-6-phosphate isomerase-like protein (cupin superfamily)
MGARVQYAFRRPRFPIICFAGRELLAAASTAAFQRQIERLDLQRAGPMDIVDSTGEGWAFHPDLMVISPFTLKKRWKKKDVIRLFNESDNARRLGTAFPEEYIPRRSLARIISEIASLTARSRPSRRARTGTPVARSGRGPSALGAEQGRHAKYKAINFLQKFGLFSERWQPRVIAEMNDYQFKVVKLQGDFIWHDHKDTDETFIVVQGDLRIDFRDGAVHVSSGEMFVVPKGVEHKPYADREVKLLLIEPRGVVNTGDEGGDRTAPNDVWI